MSGGDWKQMFKGIQEGDFELVKYYLNEGIDPNYQHPEYKAAPLIECLRYGQVEIAKLLLEKGADPLIVEDDEGDTPMGIAKIKANKEMIALLNKYISH